MDNPSNWSMGNCLFAHVRNSLPTD